MKLAIPLIVGTGVLAVGFLQWRISQRPTPTVGEESAQDRAESLRGAFQPTVGGGADASASTDPVLLALAQEFVDRLGAAFRSSDGDALDELFSMDATMAYVEAAGIVDFGPMRAVQRAQFKSGMKQGFAQGIRSNSPVLAFEDDARVVRVEELAAGEVVVYLRATSVPFQVGVKYRYWLMKETDGAWRAYDYEDLDQGVRMTALMGSVLASGFEAPPEWIDALVALGRANQAMAASPEPLVALESVRVPAEALLAYDLPPAIEGYARLLLGGSLVYAEDWDGVMEEIERIERIQPGVPVLDYMRGTAYAGLERFDESLEAYGRYADVLGWDSDLYEVVADCHYLQGDRVAGAAESTKGLELKPDAIGCLATLSLCVPEDERAGVIERVRALDEPAEAYDVILGYAKMNGETEAYATYRAALVEDDPESVLLQIHE